MKTSLLLLVSFLFFSTTSRAQFPYSLTTQTGQVYTPLSAGVSFNGGNLWEGFENYMVTMPFNFNYGSITTNNFGFMFETIAASDTQNIISGFSLIYTGLIDRGAMGSQSLSPIRYTTSGTAPNRIFKAEVFNAGFINEYFNYQTLNDSVDMQIWLYETSNALEYHFGPSQVTHPLDYFSANGYDLIGFYKNVNLNADTLDNFYYLTGNPSSPAIDSNANNSTEPSDGLTTYPANGTVYKFTPKNTGLDNVGIALKGIEVYPTLAASTVYILNTAGNNISYDLLSITGAVVTSNITLANGKNTINISTLAPGMYIIKAVGPQGQGLYKFVKE